MFAIGDEQLFIIALLALLLFGNKLPSMMRKLGTSLSEFKRAMDRTREQVRKSIEEPDAGSDKEGPDAPQAGQAAASGQDHAAADMSPAPQTSDQSHPTESLH